MGLSRVRRRLGKPKFLLENPRYVAGLSWVCHGIISNHGISRVCHGCARTEHPAQSFYLIDFCSTATNQENRQPAEGVVKCADVSETSRH